MEIVKRLKPFNAPSRFVFKDPDTGYMYEADNKISLIKHITTYREQNQLKPISNLELIVEIYLCSLPENDGRCQVIKLKRGFFQYIRGGVSLLENLMVPADKIVTQEEAEKRAAICTTCPNNLIVAEEEKENFMRWSDRLAYAAVGKRKTSLDNKLGTCGVCSCVLKAKVHAREISLSAEEKSKLPDFCWQLGGS